MRLSLSVAARQRSFAKAMRRIRPTLEPLLESFALVTMEHPIHEAILVGIADGMPPGYFEEVPNADGFFQVLAGVDGAACDEALLAQVTAALKAAIAACPFSQPDKDAFARVVQRWPR